MLNCIALYFSLMFIWEFLRGSLLLREQGFYCETCAKEGEERFV